MKPRGRGRPEPRVSRGAEDLPGLGRPVNLYGVYTYRALRRESWPAVARHKSSPARTGWTSGSYPDFIALLKDGRVLAVEYKGKDRMDLPDTKEKRRLGGLWAAKSDGRCLFALVGINDYETVLRDIVK